MITEKNVSFKSEEDGRVDKVASAIVPRSIFSQADTIIKVNGKAVKKSQKIKQNVHHLILLSLFCAILVPTSWITCTITTMSSTQIQVMSSLLR